MNDPVVVAVATFSSQRVSHNFPGNKVWLLTKIFSAEEKTVDDSNNITYVLNVQYSETDCKREKEQTIGLGHDIKDLHSKCSVQYNDMPSKLCKIVISKRRNFDATIPKNLNVVSHACFKERGKNHRQ